MDSQKEVKYLITFILIFLASWFLVGVFEKWLTSRRILDVPNSRSSHETPTPVGAGIIIVVFTLLSLFFYELVSGRGILFWTIYVGGIAIAIVSWLDDIKSIPAVVRFAVHSIAAVLAVWQFTGFEKIAIYDGVVIDFGQFGGIITVLWIVWLTNAYNFMDGIDGLAGVQAVVGSAAWGIFGLIFGLNHIVLLSLIILASSSGFLVYNSRPARVFMGDVGSAFLGYTFAILPLIALAENGSGSIKNFIPLAGIGFVWIFVADTVTTFVKRCIAMEKVWQAHRRHIYQELIKSGYSHVRITLFYGVLMIIAAGAVLAEASTPLSGVTIIVAVILTVILLLALLNTKRLT